MTSTAVTSNARGTRPRSAQSLLELAARLDAPTVSLFTPWGRGDGRRANEIRTKHSVTEAGRRLEKHQASPERRRAIQEILEQRLGELELGAPHQALALFTDGESCEIWPLAPDAPEGLHVSSNPFVRPLLPDVQSDRAFLLLELSQREPRLFLGSRWRFEETDTRLPASLEEVVGGEVESRGVQFHSQPSAGGPDAPIYHGHGGGKDDVVPELEQFLREIDKCIADDWGTSSLPLVLAGVEKDRGHFRKVSQYRRISDFVLPLVHEREHPGELHQRALRFFEDEWRRDHLEDVSSLRGHLGNGARSTIRGLEELLIAAYAGQIGRLYLRPDCEAWGRFDPRTGELTVTGEDSGDAVDELLNLAALRTLEHRGEVVVVEADDLDETGLSDLWPQDEPAIGLHRNAPG